MNWISRSARNDRRKKTPTCIWQLMAEPEKPKRDIGFRIKEPAAKYGVRKKRVKGLEMT
jgi:hypothetical protein